MDAEMLDINKERSTVSCSTNMPKRVTIYFQLQQKCYSQKIPETNDDDRSVSLEKILMIAHELMLKNKWQNLIRMCNTGLQLQQHPQLYNMKGRAQGKLGRVLTKIELTKKAIQLSPQNPAYYRNLGSAYYKLQQFQDALATHIKSVQLQQNNSINYHNVGSVLFRLGRFRDACQYFQRAVQLNRYQACSFRWLGNTYKQLGDNKKALQYYHKAYNLGQKEIDKVQIEKLEKTLYPWKVFFNNLFFC